MHFFRTYKIVKGQRYYCAYFLNVLICFNSFNQLNDKFCDFYHKLRIGVSGDNLLILRDAKTYEI
jgi:hypothetical protein